MANWEYVTAYIKLRKVSERWDYVAELPNATRVVGLSNILNQYGKKGWELVNLVPIYYDATYGNYRAATGFNAVFKRQAEGEG